MNLTDLNDTLLSCQYRDMTKIDFSGVNFTQDSRRDTTLDFIKIGITVALLILSLIGNLAVVFSVLFYRSLRTTINLYLINLAVADILISTCCMIVFLINKLTEPFYVLGSLVCKLNPFTQMCTLTVSVFTLAAISCDRFFAILYPLHSRVTKKRTGFVICFIWFVSTLVSMPLLFVRKQQEFQFSNLVLTQCLETWPAVFDSETCTTSFPAKKAYHIFAIMALFVFPVVIMTTAYSLIVWKLWVNVLPGERNEANLIVQHRAKKRVVKMVCIMLVTFVICWAPLQFIILYSIFFHDVHRSGELPLWFDEASYGATFLAYTNSALNPLIYGGFNSTFRQAILTAFECTCRPSNPQPQPSRKSTTPMTSVRWSPSHGNLSRKDMCGLQSTPKQNHPHPCQEIKEEGL